MSRLTQNITNTVAFKRLAFSPDGRLLAVASGVKGTANGGCSAVLQLFDVQTKKVVKAMLTDKGDALMAAITSLVFSPDGSRVAVGDGYNEVYVWDVKTGKRLHHINLPYPPGDDADDHIFVYSLAFSPNGKDLAASNYVLNAQTGKIKRKIPFGKSALYSPDGRFIASSDYDYSSNGPDVWFWNARSHRLIYHLPPDKDNHRTVLLSFGTGVGNKTTLVALRTGNAGYDSTSPYQEILGKAHLSVYDLKGRRLARIPLRACALSSFALSPALHHLVIINPNGVLTAPIDNHPQIPAYRILKLHSDDDNPTLSPDGHTLALSGGEEVLLWKFM